MSEEEAGHTSAQAVNDGDARAATVESQEGESTSKPPEKELLCTICGLRACWQ